MRYGRDGALALKQATPRRRTARTKRASRSIRVVLFCFILVRCCSLAAVEVRGGSERPDSDFDEPKNSRPLTSAPVVRLATQYVGQSPEDRL